MVRKILFVNLTARMGGAEFSLLRLLEGLDRKRFEPILLLPEPGLLQEKAAAIGIETIIATSLMKFGEPFRIWKIVKILRGMGTVRQIIRKRNIALLHANTARAVYACGPAAWSCAIPVVTHVRDFIQTPFASPFMSRLIGFFSDCLIAVSQATDRAVLEVNPALGEKTKVVHDGFDIENISASAVRDIRREWELPPTTKLIGSVGIIHANKGQDILVRAVARLKPLFPELKLLLIGGVFQPNEEAYKIGLEKLAAESGISENVVFTGFRHDVLSLVRELDVFVHPTVFSDALPGALIEAAILGKAIVATRVGGVAEIIEDGSSGLLVGPGDGDDLAAALLCLLRDPAKAKRLSAQARRRAISLFSLRRHVDAVQAIYERLLSSL